MSNFIEMFYLRQVLGQIVHCYAVTLCEAVSYSLLHRHIVKPALTSETF